MVIYVTRLFAVRHCETLGNVQHIFQGHADLEITEIGQKQLSALRERFSEIPLSKIYTSPLPRAVKTAQAINTLHNVSIEESVGLSELCGGVYDGLTYLKIGELYPEFKDIWNLRPWDFAPQKGEKMTDAYNRIWETVLQIAKENKDKTVVAVTHGAVFRALNCRLLHNDIKKLCCVPFGDNTAISLLEFDGDFNCTLAYYNNSDHLSEDLKNPKAKVPVVK